MTNKYAGTCRCGATVPVGEGSVHKRGRRWIVTCGSCNNEAPWQAGDRRAAREGISIARNYRGEVIGYRNTAGRCIGAPCCGCCS